MKKYLIPFLLSVVFLIISLLTISDFGINWDTPGHLLRGQALTNYLLTGSKNYGGISGLSPILIKPDERISRYSYNAFETAEAPLANLPERPLPQNNITDSIYQSENWNGQFFLNFNEGGHLALMDIFSSLINKVFFGLLGVLGDIEAYQLANLLISSAGIFIVAVFAFEITGSIFASLVAGLSLALFPLFFAEAHFNMKDPIQAVFYTGAVWAFWRWVKYGRLGWFGGFGGFVIAAFGVKWNIIFLPAVLLSWLFLIRNSKEFASWLNPKLLFFFLLFVVLLLLFIALISPSTAVSPVKQFFFTLDYYLQTGSRTDLLQPKGFILPLGFNIYPLILVLTQTPEIILVLVGLGIIGVFREKKDSLKSGYLLLLWMLLPVLRFTLPHVWFYSGYRQFMEVIPAMAVMAGIGGEYLVSVILSVAKNIYPSGFALRMTIIVVIFVFLLIPIVRLHPNQNAYFNIFAGGLRGAADKNLIDWTLTYGNIYKQGADWLNENADKDANLAFLDGSMFAISPLYLRDDISISPHHFSGFDQKGEYIMALFNPLDPPVFAKRYPERYLKPVHQIKVDEVTLLYIYKNDPSLLKSEFRQEQKMIRALAKPVKGTDRDYFEVDLAKDLLVTKVSMAGANNCFEKDNEMFAFKVKSKLREKVDLKEVYSTNEKSKADGKIDFLFPAEKASVILIYPLNDQACSLQSKLFSVSFLEE